MKIKNYWIICEAMDTDCSHRWIAFPATVETLEDVIGIVKLGSDKNWITEEISVRIEEGV